MVVPELQLIELVGDAGLARQLLLVLVPGEEVEDERVPFGQAAEAAEHPGLLVGLAFVAVAEHVLGLDPRDLLLGHALFEVVLDGPCGQRTGVLALAAAPEGAERDELDVPVGAAVEQVGEDGGVDGGGHG